MINEERVMGTNCHFIYFQTRYTLVVNSRVKSRGEFSVTNAFTFFSPDLSFLFCTFSVIAVFVTTSAKSSSSTLKYGLLQPGRNLYPVKIKNTSVAISSLFTDFSFSKLQFIDPLQF